MFLAGFFLWNLDTIFCQHLTSTKQQLMLPWSVILEGHGWWHILTGLGELLQVSLHSAHCLTLTLLQAVCETCVASL